VSRDVDIVAQGRRERRNPWCVSFPTHSRRPLTPLRSSDATNSTRARRQALVDRVKREPGLKLLFIESVCDDPVILAANIAVKVASGDPDYDGMPPEKAEADFRARIKHYEASYQALDEELDRDVTYCKMVNVGTQVSSPISSSDKVTDRHACR
jgi:hypothetical protein